MALPVFTRGLREGNIETMQLALSILARVKISELTDKEVEMFCKIRDQQAIDDLAQETSEKLPKR